MSDFTLRLKPQVPSNQDVFSGSRTVKLVLTSGSGTREIISLGSASTPLELPDLGPLVDTRVGLLVEKDGGLPDVYDPDLLVAYAEAGPFSLDTGGAVQDVPMLMAEVGGVGTLGTLPSPRIAGPVAMMPDGTVLIFGGHDPADAFPCDQTAGSGDTGVISTSCHPGSSQILRLSTLHSSAWSFEPASTALPAPLMYGTATVVDDTTGTPLVLLAGGRPDLASPDDNRDSALLYDPAADAIVWSGKMIQRRSEHHAVRLENGKVVLIGGVVSSSAGSEGVVGTTSSFEVFDPTTRSFSEGQGELGLPAIGFAAAAIPGGAIVCGGATVAPAETTPVGACFKIGLGGSKNPVAGLGQAVAFGTIIALGNGQALFCGGSEDASIAQGVAGTTTGSCQLSDGNTPSLWFPTTQQLTFTRARGLAMPWPDGRALFLGGASEAGWLDPDITSPVPCPELFDGASQTFDASGSCSEAGAGVDPQLGYDPTRGGVIVAGWRQSSSGAYLGGDVFGVVAVPPVDLLQR